uniref:SET domain-containing protein n=1 Tax=Strongyloides papillosus TaxID=174720 RepID=A0A0N5BBP1_STREA
MRFLTHTLLSIIFSISYCNVGKASPDTPHICGYEPDKHVRYAQTLKDGNKIFENVPLYQINLMNLRNPCRKICNLKGGSCSEIDFVDRESGSPKYSIYTSRSKLDSYNVMQGYIHDNLVTNRVGAIVRCPGPAMFSHNKNIQFIPNEDPNGVSIKTIDPHYTLMGFSIDGEDNFDFKCGTLKQISDDERFDIEWNYKITTAKKCFKYDALFPYDYKGEVRCSNKVNHKGDYGLILAVTPGNKRNGKHGKVRIIAKNSKVYPGEIIFFYSNKDLRDRNQMVIEPMCIIKVSRPTTNKDIIDQTGNTKPPQTTPTDENSPITTTASVDDCL